MKILIADDEAIHRDLFLAVLGQHPEHQATAVADAKTAWAMLNDRGRSFDVLFLDVRMPGMDGLELLQVITESPFHRTLQVVMCTAVNDRPTIIQAIQRGARHYIVKPCTEASIMAKLELAAKAANIDPARPKQVCVAG